MDEKFAARWKSESSPFRLLGTIWDMKPAFPPEGWRFLFCAMARFFRSLDDSAIPHANAHAARCADQVETHLEEPSYMNIPGLSYHPWEEVAYMEPLFRWWDDPRSAVREFMFGSGEIFTRSHMAGSYTKFWNGTLFLFKDICNPLYQSPPEPLFAWRTPAGKEVTSLARACFAELQEDGTLFPDRLAVLADALEDAGCIDEDILRHLRGQMPCHPHPTATFETVGNLPRRPGKVNSSMLGLVGPIPCSHCNDTRWIPLPGPHYRGCWALSDVLFYAHAQG